MSSTSATTMASASSSSEAHSTTTSDSPASSDSASASPVAAADAAADADDISSSRKRRLTAANDDPQRKPRARWYAQQKVRSLPQTLCAHASHSVCFGHSSCRSCRCSLHTVSIRTYSHTRHRQSERSSFRKQKHSKPTQRSCSTCRSTRPSVVCSRGSSARTKCCVAQCRASSSSSQARSRRSRALRYRRLTSASLIALSCRHGLDCRAPD